MMVYSNRSDGVLMKRGEIARTRLEQALHHCVAVLRTSNRPFQRIQRVGIYLSSQFASPTAETLARDQPMFTKEMVIWV